jgi:hypothetical protein
MYALICILPGRRPRRRQSQALTRERSSWKVRDALGPRAAELPSPWLHRARRLLRIPHKLKLAPPAHAWMLATARHVRMSPYFLCKGKQINSGVPAGNQLPCLSGGCIICRQLEAKLLRRADRQAEPISTCIACCRPCIWSRKKAADHLSFSIALLQQYVSANK